MKRPDRRCTVPGCGDPFHARAMCGRHYHQVWLKGIEPVLCATGCSPGRACEVHHPPICVCNTPEPSGFRGQCGRCFRLYQTNLALRDRLMLVRIAWRQFLVDEGVFQIVTGQEVPA